MARPTARAGFSAPNVTELHRAWLELVDTEGPFLAIPPLKRVWPQGMPSLSDDRRAALVDARKDFEEAWEKLDRAPANDAILDAYRIARDKWVETVLRDVAGWAESLAWGEVPGVQAQSPNRAVTVTAQGALNGVDGIGALVHVVDPTDSLRQTPNDLWAATPIDRTEALLRENNVQLGIVTDGRWWGLVSFSMCPLLNQGAIDMLLHHASEELKETYLPKMVTGEWTGTMNLTEPQAGSDVGALTTRAVPQDDGTYRITGTKIFISFGEHDMSENIIHLVLARTPDAPPGTKGISCFIVPKLLVGDDGSLGDRNDVTCVSIEHKMGIKASPTCVLSYGDGGEGAVGYLIGEENAGMRYMFTMMNNARLSVGLEGLALAERAFQMALAYAKERKQGRAPGAAAGEQSPIVDHPDVRRMLLTQRASIEALRGITYANAAAMDRAARHEDEATRAAAGELADILTPVSKGWGTDLGVELTSLALQVFGGMGYIEETGVAQHYRDARIAPIYEGTNGIQAMDLVGRKLPMRAGGAIADYLGYIDATLAELDGAGDDLASIRTSLADALAALRTATDWLLANGLANPLDALAGATPYLRLFSVVTGGWTMAQQALKATALLADASAGDKAFYEGKVLTARFFCEQLLPQAAGLVPAVTASNRDLAAAVL